MWEARSAGSSNIRFSWPLCPPTADSIPAFITANLMGSSLGQFVMTVGIGALAQAWGEQHLAALLVIPACGFILASGLGALWVRRYGAAPEHV